MPSLDENRDVWDQTYDWSSSGDEWSRAWGSAEAQWWGAIFPRIRYALPAKRILEIAPGFGRWSQFLADQCEELVVVDLSSRCIDACRERFVDRTNITFHLNDGRSLDMVQNDSLDFVFSFDSLVHASTDVIETYLRQLRWKLRPGARGFVHHSNRGSYRRYYSVTERIPRPLHGLLVKLGVVSPNSWRDGSMTADAFARACHAVGMSCIGQELINWEGYILTDCLSTFVNAPDVPGPLTIANRGFRSEAACIKRRSRLYESRRASRSPSTSTSDIAAKRVLATR